MYFIPQYLEHLAQWYSGYPLFIQIAIAVIIISIATVMLTNLVIALHYIELTIREFRLNKARKIVSKELTSHLMLIDEVNDTDIEKLAQRLKKIARKDKLINQTIQEDLIFYHHNLSGITDRLLTSLYTRLDFIKDSSAKLRSRKWNIQAEGLREIQAMPSSKVDIAYIQQLLKSNNNDLRIEAQAAYIRLNKDSPFKFLDFTSKELLDWHQIVLFDIISNTPDISIPPFKQWLNSSNLSVISFSVKLIVHYHQLDAVPLLIGLLSHSSAKIKKAVLYALGQLYAAEGEDKMIEIYHESNTPLKLKILDALGNIRSGKNSRFLMDQFLNSEEFSLIKAAGCALANQPDFDKRIILEHVENSSPKHKAILEHCMDTLIRN